MENLECKTRTFTIIGNKNEKGRVIDYDIFESNEHMGCGTNLKKMVKDIREGQFNYLNIEKNVDGKYCVTFSGNHYDSYKGDLDVVSDISFNTRALALDYIDTNNEHYKNHPDYELGRKDLTDPDYAIVIEGFKTIFTKKERVSPHKETQSTAECNNEEKEILEPNCSIQYRDGFILRNEDDTYSVMMYEYENVYSYDEESITSAKQLIDYFMEHGV